MDLEKIAARFKNMPVEQLIQVAKNSEGIRDEALQILINELIVKGAHSAAEILQNPIINDEEPLEDIAIANQEYFTSVHRKSKKKIANDPSIIDDIEEDYEARELRIDSVTKGMKGIIKYRKQLKCKADVITLLDETLKISSDYFTSIFNEIEKKRKKSLTISISIFTFFFVINVLMLTSGTTYLLIPGWIVLLIAISNFVQSYRFSKLLR